MASEQSYTKVTTQVSKDPSDKDADGTFGGGVVPHRAGYGDAASRVKRILHHATEGHTLAAGEGKLLVAHYELMLGQLSTHLDVVAAYAESWKRRFNVIRGETAWVERRRRDGSQAWSEPGKEYRVIDVDFHFVQYGDSPEEVVDALADFWEQYERDCAATPVDAVAPDGANGGTDEPRPF